MIVQDRGAQMLHFACLFLVGALFFAANFYDSRLMVPGVYGEWAYSIDATYWACGYMGASVIGVAGLYLDRWRRSPALRLIAHGAHLALFAAVAWSAGTALYGLHLTAFGVLYFVPVGGRYFVQAARDLATW